MEETLLKVDKLEKFNEGFKKLTSAKFKESFQILRQQVVQNHFLVLVCSPI